MLGPRLLPVNLGVGSASGSGRPAIETSKAERSPVYARKMADVRLRGLLFTSSGEPRLFVPGLIGVIAQRFPTLA